ncbi:HGGxSTG domain-containing protein [Oligella sp. HMSC09E12]|uniref:HGGxSTG domain-containing protein n=1 Tax=Oligella sp. HMSC09E12 TaxID=1581147 RepID=UPI0008A2FD5B|nr:HGGxSTG domain-containing protein [Oligella sp. HMSC09E12]OFV47347.1 hypothetical protein HMPREF3179_08625 [Oligella sp. HMSC09E12]
MALCGAKTRSGQPCKNNAMENGRCRMHGGRASITHKGNQNARTHGIYSDAISQDEKAMWEEIEIGGLDDAIKIARLQLRRALIAQRNAEENGGLDLDTTTQSTTSNHQGRSKTTSIQKARRPYEDIINRLLGRIGDLEAKRAEMIKKTGDSGDITELLSDLIENLPS